MQTRKILNILQEIDGRATPYDLHDLNKYFSETKGENIDILDMDIIHLIRAFNKMLGSTQDNQMVQRKLAVIQKNIDDIKHLTQGEV